MRGCTREPCLGEGNEGRRTGQRETVSWDTVPHGPSQPALGWLFRVCPNWGCVGPSFPCANQSAGAGRCGMGVTLGRGDSSAEAIPEGG